MPNSQENSARSNGVIFGGAVGIAVCLVLVFWPYQKSVSGEMDCRHTEVICPPLTAVSNGNSASRQEIKY